MKLLNGEVSKETVNSDVVTIGRSKKCTIQLPHEGISRKHIRLEVDNGNLFITDTNSTNGVFIDNVKIEPNKRIPYETFLQLSFGSVVSLQIELDAILPDENATVTKSFSKIRTYNQSSVTNRVLLNKKNQINGELSKTNFWISNCLIFGFLALMTYFYMTHDFKEVDDSNLEDEAPIEVIND